MYGWQNQSIGQVSPINRSERTHTDRSTYEGYQGIEAKENKPKKVAFAKEAGSGKGALVRRTPEMEMYWKEFPDCGYENKFSVIVIRKSESVTVVATVVGISTFLFK